MKNERVKRPVGGGTIRETKEVARIRADNLPSGSTLLSSVFHLQH